MFLIGSPGRFLKRFSLPWAIAWAVPITYAEGRSSRFARERTTWRNNR
jgi:hypothetical protein